MALVLCLSLGCGYLLVTGVSKWAPFNVRYQLPFLVAVSAVIAVALSIFPRWVTRLVLVGLLSRAFRNCSTTSKRSSCLRTSITVPT